MNSRNAFLISALCAFCITAVCAVEGASGSLYNRGRSAHTSLISNHTATSIGDIVTIIIEEESSGSRDVKTQTTKDTATQAAINTLFYPSTRFFKDNKENPAFDWESGSNYKGAGSTSSKGKLEARITARVIDMFPNGNLLIEGSRTIQIDESKLKVILTGIIRPHDINVDNTVKSTFIADAKIEYVEEGLGNVNRFGILTRLWNWMNIF